MLQKADNAGDSTEFVEFMLGMIRNALKELSENQGKTDNNGVARNVVTNEDKVLELLRQDGRLTARVLSLSLGLTQRQVQRILASLKEEKKIIRYGASKNGEKRFSLLTL
nr:winged helix-turn-helix transcriptional regulator [Shuttleworthia satelles]